MMYFWLIPVVAILLLLVWLLFVMAANKTAARTDGKTVVDHRAERG